MSPSRPAVLAALLVAGLCAVASMTWWLGSPPGQEAVGDPEVVSEAAALEAAAEEPDHADLAAPALARQTVAPSVDDGRVRVLAARVLVFDAQGRALQGAAVEAAGGDAQDEQATGEDGVALLHLPPTPSVSLRVSADDHLATALPEHGFGQEVTVTLRPAASFTVRVADAQGAPLANASLELRGRQTERARTDARGLVTWRNLLPGTYDLGVTCRAEGVACAAALPRVYLAPGANERELRVPRGGVVAVAVVDKATRQPLAASLTLHWEARAGNAHAVHDRLVGAADHAGRHRFVGVPAGLVVLRASAPGYVEASVEHRLLDTAAGLTAELALERAAELQGKVVDPAGQPVANAEVTLGQGSKGGLRFGETVRCATDGAFVLVGVAPGEGYLLGATGRGFAPGGLLLGAVRPGEARRDLVVALKRGGRVRGRVRDSAGAPLAGARVRLVPRHGADRFARHVDSDGRGQFEFVDIAEFAYRVEINADDHWPHSRDLDVKAERELTDAGEFVLRRAHHVDGVLLARGTPYGLAGARVVVRSGDGKAEVLRTTTDSLGRFRLLLPEADYRCDFVGAEIVRGATGKLKVPHEGVARFVADTQLPPGTGNMSVRVLDAYSRAPLPGVTISGVDPRRVGYADGVYGLRGVTAGRYDFGFALKGYQSATLPGVTVAAGEERLLRDVYLQPAARLVLTVLDERGRPFPANQLKLQLVDQQSLTAAVHLRPAAIAADRGLYEFEGLAPSRFELRVVGPNSHVAQTKAVDIAAAQPVELRVQLARKPRPKKK